jgi:hypothetical protein
MGWQALKDRLVRRGLFASIAGSIIEFFIFTFQSIITFLFGIGA